MISGALVGLVLGLFGSGGSTLAIPLLHYFIGVESKPAIAMSLVVVGVAALYGFYRNWRGGQVSVRSGLILGVSGVLGGFGGAKLSVFLTGEQQLLLFSIIVILAAGSMIKKTFFSKENEGEEQDKEVPLLGGVLAGLAIGVLTGLVGVGGGFLIVPVLHAFGVSLKRAIGTSLMIISFNAASGAMGYIGLVEYDWSLLGSFIATALVATQIGVALVHRLPVVIMKKSFAIFLLILGIAMLIKNSSQVLG